MAKRGGSKNSAASKKTAGPVKKAKKHAQETLDKKSTEIKTPEINEKEDILSKYRSKDSDGKKEIYQLQGNNLRSIDNIINEIILSKDDVRENKSQSIAVRIMASDNEIAFVAPINTVRPEKEEVEPPNSDNENMKEEENIPIRAITYMDLSSNYINSSSIKSFISISDTLRFLNLSGNKITSLANISKLENLMCLILTNNKIKDISPLADMTNLNTLLLGQNSISEVPIKVFQRMRLLRKLVLSHNELKEVPDLTGCTALNELRLAHNRIALLPMTLAANADLSVLDVSQNGIETMNALSPLSQLRHLRHLFISDNPVFTRYIDTEDKKDKNNEKDEKKSASRLPGAERFYTAVVRLNEGIRSVNGVATSPYGGGKRPERPQQQQQEKKKDSRKGKRVARQSKYMK